MFTIFISPLASSFLSFLQRIFLLPLLPSFYHRAKGAKLTVNYKKLIKNKKEEERRERRSKKKRRRRISNEKRRGNLEERVQNIGDEGFLERDQKPRGISRRRSIFRH